MSDSRFARLHSDPRFRRPKKAKTKVVLDDRFKSIFEKDDKKSGKRVDKYGRKVAQSADSDNLKRFYRLGNDDDGGGIDDAKPDLARGEGLLESSSEDDDESAPEDEDEDDALVVLGRDTNNPIAVHDEIDLDEDVIAELDAQAASYTRQTTQKQEQTATDPTSRIAVVNLDWDFVKAPHLFKIFSSVDKIRAVRIYPSEFGKERMAREEREGPPQEVWGKGKGKAVESEDEEDVNERTIYEVNDGQEYDQDALRKYQLERLRYYYAIVTCDSVQAAEHIYNELEGTELERSANVFDLSYVPEDMEFDDDFRDEATEDVATFKAVDFATDALRHSKVKLTWDADDAERTRITRRTLSRKDLDEIDFKAYIASDSEDEEEDDAARREKMRQLLLHADSDEDQLPEGWGTGKPDKAGELEITFTPALTSRDDGAGEDETTLEKYKRKTKEKKAARKAARKTKQSGSGDAQDEGDEFFGADSDSDVPKRKDASAQEIAALIAENEADGGDGLQHFDMRAVLRADKAAKAKGKLAKRMKKKLERGAHADETGEGFVLDVADARFSALHDNPAFAIDPSNPKFKRTKGMEALLEERSRRQQGAKKTQEGDDGDLTRLVESVKRKAKARAGDARVGKRQRVD